MSQQDWKWLGIAIVLGVILWATGLFGLLVHALTILLA